MNKSNIKPVINDISSISDDQLDKVRNSIFYPHQIRWYNNKHYRIRFIIKGRQFGSSYYFAWEGFEDAVKTGDNQIFVARSLIDLQVFRTFIKKFSLEYFGVRLVGNNCIKLSNGAEIRFVLASSETLSNYTGHLYIDEVFWMKRFNAVNAICNSITAQTRWRKTFSSSYSFDLHDACLIWRGQCFNDNRTIKAEFDLSLDSLAKGIVGADGIWRNVVTVYQAIADGCHLFDIDELKNNYNEDEFTRLFLCGFFESDAKRVMVDSKPMWIDYDPARSEGQGDNNA